MAPLTVMDFFRNNRRASDQSSPCSPATPTASSPSPFPIIQVPVDANAVSHTSTSQKSYHYRSSSAEEAEVTALPEWPYQSDSLHTYPADEEKAVERLKHMPNKLRRPDHDHHYTPPPATVERPDSAASTGSRGAQHYVFSLQPPQKFSASLTPNESPLSSPVSSTAPPVSSTAPPIPERSHLRNVSSSSLSAVDEAGPSKHQSRPSKGKLHLLNPLSLLSRRRAASHNQLPKPEETTLNAKSPIYPNLPDDYDPRIRGKIVHDFSVPKSKRLKTYNGPASAETSPSIGSRPSSQAAGRLPDRSPPIFPRRTSFSPPYSPALNEYPDEKSRENIEQSTLDLPSRAPAEPPKLPEFAMAPPLGLFNDDDQGRRFSAVVSDLVTSTKIDEDHPPDVPAKDEPRVSPPARDQPSPDLSPQDRPPSYYRHHASPSDPLPMTKSRISTNSRSDQNTSSTRLNEISVASRRDKTSLRSRSDQTSAADFLRPGETLPRHVSNKSSRFSFQLFGMGSELQERLLEAKHKSHAAKLSSSSAPADDSISEASHYSDDFGEDDGLEEAIPGVNVDLDDSPEPTPTLHFTPEFTTVSSATSQFNSNADEGVGPTINFASFSLGPYYETSASGLGISEEESAPEKQQEVETQKVDAAATAAAEVEVEVEDTNDYEDDMYFDDGNIQGLDVISEGDSFDEDMFDDGRIKDIPAMNAQKLENHQMLSGGNVETYQSENIQLDNYQNSKAQLGSNQSSGAQLGSYQPSDIPRRLGSFRSVDSSDEETVFVDKTLPLRIKTDIGPEHTTGLEDSQANKTQSNASHSRTGLTEDNLAYQNMLVSAANKAAAQGRFVRNSDLSEKSPPPESQPGLISDDSRLSHLYDRATNSDDDDFNFDDLEDDTMIAEANAEALANDDDGFYGQEFGFYARAPGKDAVGRDTQAMINGGFFGARGVESVHRRHSAKDDFQEPSLTPITERSDEWSRRDSVASVHTQNFAPIGGLQSPGLAQLRDLDSAGLEDEMSLSALMKLRRGAWGGSQTSLSSASGSQSGSIALPGPQHAPESGSINKDFRRFHDVTPLSEVAEESRTPRGETPDLHLTPRKKHSDPSTDTASVKSNSPSMSRSYVGDKPSKGHSRASSGAESVSYTMDPDGSGRWLLERRRTGDDGELELVGREYITGARI